MTAASTAVLGGETRHRGAFTGRQPKALIGVAAAAFAAGITLMMTMRVTGILITLGLWTVLFAATRTLGSDHSMWSNMQDRRRYAFAARHWGNEFRPITDRPDDTPRRGRVHNMYRSRPNGATGLYWLPVAVKEPAVGYHVQPGDTPYLAVTFAVDGPITGVGGAAAVEAAQEGFAALMAGWGQRQKLVSGIQVTTRLIPPGTAAHQAWLRHELDPDVDPELVVNYTNRLDKLTGFSQRHWVTLRWDRTPHFDDTAARYAPGWPGWRDTVLAETRSAVERLTVAGYREVTALSASRLAAVIRHLQNPGISPDRASDATLDNMWLPTRNRWGHVEQPDSGWVHRTAQFPPRFIEAAARDGMWLRPLLTGMGTPVLRTVSVHIRFVPAMQARSAARSDVTGDTATLTGQAEKGKLLDDATELSLRAARDRLTDVSTGTGHHGAEWAGFVTVSAPTVAELARHVQVVEEAADTCGITQLHWLDTIHDAAAAYTWPVARSFPSPRHARSVRALELGLRLTRRTR